MMNLTARMPSCRLQLHQNRRRHGMDIKILENLLQVTIDWGNLMDSPQPVIQNRIMIVLGLLKGEKVRLGRTIDQGNLIKLLGMRCNHLSSSWKCSSRRKCAIRKVRTLQILAATFMGKNQKFIKYFTDLT